MCASRYVDPRTRTDRIQVQNQHWDLQMEHLVRAYLGYRAQDRGDGMPNALPSDELTAVDGECPSLKNIELVDVFGDIHGTPARFITNVVYVGSARLCSLGHLTSIRLKLSYTVVDLTRGRNRQMAKKVKTRPMMILKGMETLC
jgi:hypothetical protein